MENSSASQALDVLLLPAIASLALAVLATVAVLLRGARRVGREIRADRPLQVLRYLALMAVGAASAAVVVHWSEIAGTPALAVLALAAVLFRTAPSSRDSVLGERGVRHGWHARGFEEIEEWRLTGEHLRWKLFGEWQAVRVPPERRDELRERLVSLCPGRESRFKD